METTPSGNDTLVRLEQDLNAAFSILVTGYPEIVLGISKDPRAVVLQSVMITESYFIEYERSSKSAPKRTDAPINKAIKWRKKLTDFIIYH